MHKPMKGWFRLGVVMSLIWIGTSTVAFGINDFQFTQRAAFLGVSHCTDAIKGAPVSTRKQMTAICFRQLDTDMRSVRQLALGKWLHEIAGYGVAPLLVALLIGFVLIRLFRWVRAGFEGEPTQS